MNNARALARSSGAACFVAAVAPVVAFVCFWAVVSASSTAVLPFHMRELGGLYVEVKLPTTVASVLFAASLFGLSKVQGRQVNRFGIAALGAACFVAVFGWQFFSSLVLRTHFSGTGFLIAVLGSLAGAVSAALLPQALLPLGGEAHRGG
ncbi:hypothetical protein [Ideonella sp. BN130291]|uniref:hypothetical protein n=1 Tax=Ideonella sp. BN130291 TaxID=3112940 RepID=UPI002E2643E9|nr:hypothetical protein [Ideonella sp. BN130291]